MAERKKFLNDYETVQERIAKFYAKYPDGRIFTQLMSDPANWEQCRYKAMLFRSFDESDPISTGHATETIDNEKNFVNRTFHEENAESSAIGRALANAGFAARSFASRNEESFVKTKATESGGDHPVIQVIWDKARSVGVTAKLMKAYLMQEFGVPTSKALDDVQIAKLAEAFENVESLDEFEALLQDEAVLMN